MAVRPTRDAVLLFAALVIVAAGLKAGKPLLAPLLLAGFVAVITAPLVRWLTSKGIPTGIAVVTGVLVDALVIGSIGLVIASAVAELAQRQGFYEERFGSFLDQSRVWLLDQGVEVSRSSLESFISPGALLSYVGEGMKRIAAALSQFLVVLFIVAFMLVESTTLRRKLALIIRDPDERLALRKTTGELRSFLIVKLGTSITTGLLAGLLCYVTDVDLPLLWALLAFLLNFIPTVGSIIAAIPPTILALALHGPGTALAVAGGYLVMNATIGSLLEPRLMGNAIGLSPLVVFLSMLFWGYLLGVVGALLSPTLTLFVRAWLERSDMRWLAVLMSPAPKEDASEA